MFLDGNAALHLVVTSLDAGQQSIIIIVIIFMRIIIITRALVKCKIYSAGIESF